MECVCMRVMCTHTYMYMALALGEHKHSGRREGEGSGHQAGSRPGTFSLRRWKGKRLLLRTKRVELGVWLHRRWRARGLAPQETPKHGTQRGSIQV